MIELLITILILVFFTICFKWFEKFNAHNFSAIIVNYLTAGILGFFSSKELLINIKTLEPLKEILLYSSLIGALFIVVFNLIAYSTQQIGILKQF